MLHTEALTHFPSDRVGSQGAVQVRSCDSAWLVRCSLSEAAWFLEEVELQEGNKIKLAKAKTRMNYSQLLSLHVIFN